MIPLRRRPIEEKLESLPVPARPVGLASAIKREIPAGLRLPPASPAPRGLSHSGWRLAAALVVAIGGGLLGLRMLRESRPPGELERAAVPQPLNLSLPARPDLAASPPASSPVPRARQVLPRPPMAISTRRNAAAEPGPEGRPFYQEGIDVTAEAPRTDTRVISVGALRSGAPEPAFLPPPASTGGTAEPNDQPYGDVFFRSHGVNPFVDTEDDPLSTFGLEVDTGSYGVAGAYLRDGHLPPAEAIRVEEFVNAFRYGDAGAAAEGGADFSLRAEGAPSPFAGGDRYRLLRFHLRARTVDPADRPPSVLTFVVDVSGSMGQDNRLGLVKRALGLLLDQLRPDDRVGLVVYGTTGRVLLPHTGDLERLRAAVDALQPEGATNAEEGLRLAYDLASQAHREGAIHRVILCSDGVANVGATGADSILARIGEEARRGIELTAVGFGMGNFNDVLMERLADTGNGRYTYVEDLRAARRAFVEDLTGTLQTIAADAKAQVEFDPRVVERWRLLGYENRDIADERFRDDRVDAGEIGAGHEVTALYEVKLRRRVSTNAAIATLRVRYRPVDADGQGDVVETAHVLHRRELAPSWERASRGLRLAAVVAELAEVLKQSYWARGSSLDEVARRAAAATKEFPSDERVTELADLAARAAALARPAAAEERTEAGEAAQDREP